MDLENLMQSLKNGNVDALAEIYELTKSSVYASIYGITRSNYMVEDIMQETYLKTYKNINSYKSQGQPKAWICKIAKNLTLDKLKQANHTVPIENYENQLVSYDPTPDEITDTYNDIIDIAKKILKQDELKIVLMHTVGELNHLEIAKTLGKPHATVRWTYHSAIKKIKKYIAINKVEL